MTNDNLKKSTYLSSRVRGEDDDDDSAAGDTISTIVGGSSSHPHTWLDTIETVVETSQNRVKF